MRPTALTRSEAFIRSIDALLAGLSVEIQGVQGVGKTALLQNLASHFESMQYSIIRVSGNMALMGVPFSTLHLSGYDAERTNRSSTLSAIRQRLISQCDPSRNLIIIDDADQADQVSLGLLFALAQEYRIPVLSSVRYPADPLHGSGRSDTPLVLQYPTMTYVELAAALEAHFHARFDSETLSRLYSKSGGRPGAAIHVTAINLQNGRVRLEEGVLTAVDTMWSPELTSYLSRLIADLTPDELRALKLLSFLGVCDLTTAITVTGSHEILLSLERRGLLTCTADTGNGVVFVDPQLLVDYFRNEEPSASRRLLTECIREVTAERSMVLDIDDSDLDPLVLVRLVHEQIRNDVLVAREQWHQSRNLSDAAALLRALSTDWHSESATDEILALIASIDASLGTPEERVAWEVAYAAYVTYAKKLPREAIARLRTIKNLPEELQLICEAEASVLETCTDDLSSEEPFADVDLDGLQAGARAAVLRARTLWLLARGRPNENESLFDFYYSAELNDPLLDAVFAQTKFALLDFESGTHLINQRLERAKQQFDPRALCIFTHLSALASIYRRDYVKAQHDLNLAEQMGIPLAAAPNSWIGIVVLKAYLLAVNGAIDDAEAQLKAFDDFTLNAPPFPGYIREMVDQRIIRARSGDQAATEFGMTAADALWERGGLYAASITMLEVLQSSPTPELYADVAVQLRELPAPILNVWLALLDFGIHGDTTILDAHGARAEDPAIRDLFLTAASYIAGGFSDSFVTHLLTFPPLEPIAQRLRTQNTDQRANRQATLTEREDEIAALVSAGLTNAEIASRLTLSVRTVEGHVSRILKKLQKSTREDIAHFYIDQSARQRPF